MGGSSSSPAPAPSAPAPSPAPPATTGSGGFIRTTPAAATGAGVRIDWNWPVRREVEAPWLWFVVPGFVANANPVTIFRSTHPEFRESMRLFGIPAGHPCRLESHLPGELRPDWVIGVTRISHLGVCEYALCGNGGAANAALTAKGSGVAIGADAASPDAGWFLIPGPAGFGWDVFHRSGRKLVAAGGDAAAKTLELVAELGAPDHWDVMWHAPDRANHRFHYWLPEFFAQTLPSPWPAYSTYTDPMAAVVGTVPSPAAPSETNAASGPGECMQRCRGRAGCTVAAFDDTDKCYTWQNASLAPAADAHGQDGPLDALNRGVRGDAVIVQRQRRLLRDKRARNTDGTGEFGPANRYSGRNPTFFVMPRDGGGAGKATDRLRDCLVRYGLDGAPCDALMETVPAATVDAVLGGDDGLCQGPDLHTKRCQTYCTSRSGREGVRCEGALRDWCAIQTVGGREEPMCSCWLAPETYQAIRAEANRALSQGQDGDILAKVTSVFDRMQPPAYCWYDPCRTAKVRPPDDCPPSEIAACIQVSRGNTYTSGGSQVHDQVCNLAANSNITRYLPSGTGSWSVWLKDHYAAVWVVVGGAILLLVLLLVVVLVSRRRRGPPRRRPTHHGGPHPPLHGRAPQAGRPEGPRPPPPTVPPSGATDSADRLPLPRAPTPAATTVDAPSVPRSPTTWERRPMTPRGDSPRDRRPLSAPSGGRPRR